MKTILNTKYLKAVVGVGCIAAISTGVNAQELTLMNMKGMPGLTTYNPAYHSDSSAFFVSFLRPSVDVGTTFAFGDFVTLGRGSEKTMIDLNKLNSMATANGNGLYFLQEMPALSFSIMSKKGNSFSFGLRERMMSDFMFDKGLVELLTQGNSTTSEKNQSGMFGINTSAFLETSLGYSRNFFDRKLTVGANIKFLRGLATARGNNLGVNLHTTAGGQTIDITTSGEMFVSAPVNFTYDAEGYIEDVKAIDDLDPLQYYNEKPNKGMAFDLGVVYKPIPNLTVSAGFIDLGAKIKWENHLTTLVQNGSYSYSGIDISNSIDDNSPTYKKPDDLMQDILDDMEKSFKPKGSTNAYTQKLPVQTYLTANYALTKGISVYAMERLAKNNAFSRNAFTVGASTQLARFLSLSTGYVNTNGDSYLGLGASVRVGCMQLYVSTDNISVMKSFPPGKTSNVSFGLNMLFGRKHQKKGYPKYYEEVTPPEVPVEIPEIPEETTEPEKAIQ